MIMETLILRSVNAISSTFLRLPSDLAFQGRPVLGLPRIDSVSDLICLHQNQICKIMHDGTIKSKAYSRGLSYGHSIHCFLIFPSCSR